MPKKTPPYKNYTKWTEARFYSFIRSALRSAWTKYPPKYEALKYACVGKQINPFSGKQAQMYKCAECNRIFPVKMVQVDHITPNHPLKSFDDIGEYCKTLFCSKEELQVLCNYKGIVEGLEACHKIKTRNERSARKV